MKILVLNGGSSSFKCWFADVQDSDVAQKPLWSARADWSHHTGVAEIRITRGDGASEQKQLKVDAPVAVLEPVLRDLVGGPGEDAGPRADARGCQTGRESGPETGLEIGRKSARGSARDTGPEAGRKAGAKIDVVGHRIVHGGPEYRESTRLSPEVRAAIARQVEFAPSHNRFELEAIQAVDRVVGTDVPQIAVFDTGFHATLEPAAYVYPGPYAWLEQGIRRYGFHGISHRYAARRAAQMLGRDAESLRLIICHLGNGASLAAVRGGRSVDTTMGFTPLEGLMMGTRCGSIDPGILVYMVRHCGYTAEQLDQILNRESGLLGVSGISGDMREIVEAMVAGNERARLAFDVYAHRLTREVGAMLAVLGGADALVFTGGVGENCAPLREVVCRQLEFLGVKLDGEKNARPKLDEDVAGRASAVRVLVVRAEEEWEIARECWRICPIC